MTNELLETSQLTETYSSEDTNSVGENGYIGDDQIQFGKWVVVMMVAAPNPIWWFQSFVTGDVGHPGGDDGHSTKSNLVASVFCQDNEIHLDFSSGGGG